ncbi:hypothetical protein GCM10010168_47990 [Actinoplanes ianthinogenes]|uniref:Lipoprotein n=1 Tax=Actinoplanes ianthinogenes TaxID=122358 RepID=A0ABN6C8F0_9ACTN|nr:hypothetical protein [Actinoplanes ianthinogenes]BCJ40901.1 hypothetical protein Aiant_15580 [Actinoplanes ianthinogenes]GGR24357.1 hypothetical protein GCM10010168_47990 [Actinoplanes ianthinogenes]
MRTRITAAVLFTAAALSLSACSDDDKTEAGSTPTTAPAASSVASAPSDAPRPDNTPSQNGAIPAPAGGGNADKVICEATNTAGESMKTAMLTIMKANNGDIKPADAKKILDDFTKAVNQALDQAPESTVATAARKISDEAAKAAAASDPVDAAAAPEFEKAGTAFTTACKTVGVPVNF